MKKMICEICCDPDCDGKEFVTPDMSSPMGLHMGIRRVCKNHEDVISKDGKLYYRIVSGHGMEDDYPLTEVKK